jgi:hypothetical protein
MGRSLLFLAYATSFGHRSYKGELYVKVTNMLPRLLTRLREEQEGLKWMP